MKRALCGVLVLSLPKTLPLTSKTQTKTGEGFLWSPPPARPWPPRCDRPTKKFSLPTRQQLNAELAVLLPGIPSQVCTSSASALHSNVHFSGILLYVHRLPHASFCFTKVLSDALDSSGCLGNSCCYQKMYFLRAEKIGMTGRFAKTALRLFERTRNPLV